MAHTKKIYRSLLHLSADGHIDIVDLTGGVRLNQFHPATSALAAQGISTREQMFDFCHGVDAAKKAAMSLAYYPQETKDSVMPKPEDFVAADFRLLSATVVGAGSWKVTDFTDEKMLKASAKMLDRKPIFTNHDTQVENWAGIVSNPVWAAASKSGSTNVPAGINATLLIDTKTRPEIARGVLLGSINSNSVTVEFEWAPSHQYAKEYEFIDKLGSVGDDGEMVRRVATKITGYHETSLVWLGADPFAKLLGADGQVTSIDKGHVYAKEPDTTAKQRYTSSNSFSIASGYDANVLRLAQEKNTSPAPIATQTEMKPEVVALLIALFNVSKAEDLTEDQVKQFTTANAEATKKALRFSKLESLSADQKVTELDEAGIDKFMAEHKVVPTQRYGELAQAEITLKAAGDVVALKKELEDTKLANTSLAAEAELGKTFLQAKREQLTSLYKKAVGEKADAALVDTFSKSDSKALDGFLKMYTSAAGEKYGMTCTKCGTGDHTEFRSSLVVLDKEEEATEVRTAADIVSAKRQGGFGQQTKK